ncbi:hypothetical protein BKA00_007443 [Actinomadura coerulea]|uniref:Uncharacterized protein n=1 Tax=Actinomadura coerulea TaxID=46159 RepID=A0A7X0G7A5_9ACTN|nr:hypothetical protein [Actinomadura coerulea]MBB6400529.1 hypothetical protein [Actinomadura coerulea]GGQ07876.1 hypothetical protein GCM10010187_24960 [Actinomadura coerulea]
MKLYLAKRITGGGYDTHAGMVIRAESYGDARRLLNDALYSSEQDGDWRIARVREEGSRGVILKDFCAG